MTDSGPVQVRVRELDGRAEDSVLLESYRALPVGASWSPDGSKIAYVRGDGLYVAGRDGSDPQLVLRHDLLGGPLVAWSPGGDRLAVQAFAGFVGETRPLIVDTATGDTHTMPGTVGFWTDLDWSPDGRNLALVGYTGDPSGHMIWVVPVNASRPPEPLTSPFTEDVQWAPGQQLLFGTAGRWTKNGNCAEGFDIWTIGLDGSDASSLSDPERIDYSPVWSPDGTWIAFASARPGSSSGCRPLESLSVSIWVMRADGSDAHLVVEGDPGMFVEPLAWWRDS